MYKGGQPSLVYKGGQPSLVYKGGQSSLVYKGGQLSLVYKGGQSSLVYKGGQSSLVYKGGQSSLVYKGGQPSLVYKGLFLQSSPELKELEPSASRDLYYITHFPLKVDPVSAFMVTNKCVSSKLKLAAGTMVHVVLCVSFPLIPLIHLPSTLPNPFTTSFSPLLFPHISPASLPSPPPPGTLFCFPNLEYWIFSRNGTETKQWTMTR